MLISQAGEKKAEEALGKVLKVFEESFGMK